MKNHIPVLFSLAFIGIYLILVGTMVPVFAASPPDPVSNLLAIPGNGSVELLWSAPPNNGAPITSYKIISWKTGQDIFTTYPNLSTITAATVTGLENGVSYSFKVIAINSAGQSTDSNIVSVIPSTLPSPSAPERITDLKVVRDDGKVKLTWSAPYDNGNTITNYEIKYWEVGTSNVKSKTISAVTNAQITGLTNGISYAFKVIAINSAGSGPDSNIVSATPSASVSASVPNQVRGVNAIPSNGQVFLTWVAPSANGSPITSYSVIVSEINSNTFTTFPNLGTVTQTTISGLKNGVMYSFKVIAINAIGSSKESSSVTATPNERVPIQILNLRATPGDGRVTLNWSIPSTAIDTISSFRVRQYAPGQSSFDTHTFLGQATKATITGLQNGVPYGFSIVAVSFEGIGPESNIVYATPTTAPSKQGIPNAIKDLSAVVSAGKVILSWTPPSDNSSPITRYNIQQQRSDYSSYTTHPVSGDSSEAEIAGLVNGITYSFKISAINSVGASPDSNTVIVTPKIQGQTLNLPSWIKTNAKWWAEGKISDSEFVQAIEYLINQKIIRIK